MRLDAGKDTLRVDAAAIFPPLPTTQFYQSRSLDGLNEGF
jgi:hypothetical protein